MGILKVFSKTLLIVLLLCGLVTACKAGGISPRTDAETIRRNFLAQTPVGTSFEDVMGKLSARGYRAIPSLTAGFLRQEKGQLAVTVGVSSIRADIGDYWTFPFLTTSVSAFWGFDAEGKLMDIWIWKTTDAP